ncbi:MAG: N-acetyl-gamma-glutamyl-phosphate reductase [Solirubrobacterales bacterium]
MIQTAIIGDGYTAAELVRLLAGHGGACVAAITSTEHIGRRFDEVYPQLTGMTDIVLEPTDSAALAGRVQAVFLALPHGLSVPIVGELVKRGIRCVDLGADFRLQDPAVYQAHYHLEHKNVDLLARAVYGLPEIYREKICGADVVANPGCYPTSAILALAPLLKANLIAERGIIVDSKSGVSGAGRGLALSSHFCEANEGVKAYSVGTHRHRPEIEQELSHAAQKPIKITFTPHLIPMSRGMLSTAYADLLPGVSAARVREAFEAAYTDEPFVRLLPPGTFPQTKWTYGSNYAFIGVHVAEEEGRVIVVSAIDNLTKGASGQAVQNLNLMFGLPETQGLLTPGVSP